MSTTQKVWLITGASNGLGLALAKQLLAAGHYVAATSRSIKALEQKIGKKSAQFFPLALDLNDDSAISQAVAQVVNYFGRIDTLVNNAGYGQMGTLEELSEQEVRANFNINVFAMMGLIRHVVPYLRQQQSGHIINISSMAGIKGDIAGWGAYVATKFAVAGLTEALYAELQPFGIKVSLVYPGHMRTQFLTPEAIHSPQQPLAVYQQVRTHEAMVKTQMNGQQIGDPEKAAALLMELDQRADSPLHFFMGDDVYQAAEQKIIRLQQDLARWQQQSHSIGIAAHY